MKFPFKDYTNSDPVRYYGINIILRKYLCIPKWLPLIAFTEHGWTPLSTPLNSDLAKKKYPLMFVYSKRRLDAYKETAHNFKKVLILGMPFILYRISEKILIKEDAKGTIAFPSHGTDLVKSEYNIKTFCKKLNELPPKFHPVTICLHSKNMHEETIYNSLGFEVVSAGSQSEIKFYYNFYEILTRHKYTVSNSVGSYIFYSIDLGIPFFLIDEEPIVINHSSLDINVPEKYKGTDFLIGKEAYDIFNTGPVDYISERQQKYVEKETGIKEASSRVVLILYYWIYFAQWVFIKSIKKIAKILYILPKKIF